MNKKKNFQAVILQKQLLGKGGINCHLHDTELMVDQKLFDAFDLAGILFSIGKTGTHHGPFQERKVDTLGHTVTHSVIHDGKFYYL